MDFTEQGVLKIADDNAAPAVTDAAPGTDTTTTDTAPATNDAPAAADTQEAQTEQPQTTTTQQAAATDAPVINYNDYLSRISGGVIKDEDGLKTVLPKIQQYENLQKENQELAAKMAKAPVFANDHVRIFNELVTKGATAEQLDNFQKINKVGDINDLAPIDAKIAKMVIVDGVKESTARLMVEREYKIGEAYANLEPEDREIEDERLRLSAKDDKAALAQFKADVSQTSQVPPEELQLQQTAKIQEHQAIVKPYVQEVVAGLPNLGVFNLSGKEGDEAVNFSLPIDDSHKAQMSQLVENYFMDGLTPITPESTREAINFAWSEVFRENAAKFLQGAYNHGVSMTTEKLVNKYENRSGIKTGEDNPVMTGGGNEAAKTAGFMQNMVNRTW